MVGQGTDVESEEIHTGGTMGPDGHAIVSNHGTPPQRRLRDKEAEAWNKEESTE